MAAGTSIETGVDKLVKLIAKEKRIELSEAAKQLNVDAAVVQEWADFLEQEGLIDLQYSLSKAYLVEKHLSKQDVEKKGKEYDNKKEAFIRKVDATLKKLESETADFESINTRSRTRSVMRSTMSKRRLTSSATMKNSRRASIKIFSSRKSSTKRLLMIYTCVL